MQQVQQQHAGHMQQVQQQHSGLLSHASATAVWPYSSM
jgi:hypothetical protein